MKVGNLTFASGQLPIDPETGKIIEGDIETQTWRALENLQAVLEPYSIGLENVVKTTIFLKDMNIFASPHFIKIFLYKEKKLCYYEIDIRKRFYK
ncbi:MAG: deaminase [Candidatus Infernicultor aquiphilus]|uniref:Deaminase n=1 Tax=Candidatus Infernicultor aquiphilus TaxID=1805029 RepID=A0A1J5GPJ3_9BACT|nr:MAG: hypothetical protein AUK42_05960 [Candidatus Atribacteria bacterium CG2_30_33_13]PIX34210.1 MAG: deaminase [Candidatus Atribacteria bacterium CG_4_8_14_3_um_filter_34_18]